MKKLNIYLLLIFLMFTSFTIMGCGESGENNNNDLTTKLPTPIIKWDYENERVCWDKIEHAGKYDVVFCNTKNGNVVKTYYDNFLILENETYTIKVKAISESSKYENSDFSQTTTFTISNAITPNYIKSERNGDSLTIYFFDLSGLPNFHNVTFYDDNNHYKKTVSKNQFQTTTLDLTILLAGVKTTLKNHECFIYVLDLANISTISLNARFFEKNPFIKSSYRNSIYTC